MAFDRTVPKWLDEFLTTMHKGQEEIVKQADLNVGDLPKITWNEEVFHVLFDVNKVNNHPCAHIINEFGNIVTTVTDVENIEQVDEKLNSKNLVPTDKEHEDGSEIFEEELKKASAYLDDNLEKTSDVTTNEQPDIVVFEKPEDGEQEKDCDEITVLNSKIAALETMVNNLTEQFGQFSNGQQYARSESIEQTDLGIQEQEQQAFEEDKNVTEIRIKIEHEIDLTTPEGRVALYDALKNTLESEPSNSFEEIPVDETAEVKEPVDATSDEQSEESLEKEATVDSLDIVTELEEIKEELEELVEYIELDSDECELFKTKHCPVCDDEDINIDEQDDDFVKFNCNGCNTQYKFDKATDKIYRVAE